MKLKDSKTYQNLARAYASECNARARYEFIEYGARNQGYKAMAEVIDTIVFQEFNHARMIYTFIQTADKGTIDNIEISAGLPFREKWNLLDNLALAAKDESNEIEVYTEFKKVAEQEGFHDIAGMFNNIMQVEKLHKKIFEELHTQMKNGTLYKKAKKVTWVCADCGYEENMLEAWTECPLCQAKQGVVALHLDSVRS